MVKLNSIKELSNALNISKVSLYRMVKSVDIAPHTFKKGGITYVSDEGVALLRIHYSRERDAAFNAAFNHDKHAKNSDIITILQDQLNEKDNQINALLTIVKNQQQLQFTSLLPDSQFNTVELPKSNEKKSFWAWFKK